MNDYDDVVDLHEMARYLSHTYQRIEAHQPSNADYEVNIHEAIVDVLKRLRKRVLTGTYVQSWAAKGFMHQMRALLLAYNDHMVATEDQPELEWYDVLDLAGREELCSLLLEELHDHVHNYRSTKAAA